MAFAGNVGVVIARDGRPEAVLMAVSDLEPLEETLDLLATPGAVEQSRQAEADIAAGQAIDADELRTWSASTTAPKSMRLIQPPT